MLENYLNSSVVLSIMTAVIKLNATQKAEDYLSQWLSFTVELNYNLKEV